MGWRRINVTNAVFRGAFAGVISIWRVFRGSLPPVPARNSSVKAHSFDLMLLAAACVSVVVVVVLSYGFMLTSFFSGTDTFTLIETSRISSFKDVWRIFSEPLMGQTKFVDVARFYRPISTLSYSLDVSLWGLEPFGFQLTNLLLHALVSILVVLLMRALVPGSIAFPWLSGFLFAAHPILVESVPAIDRRHDVIAALFLVCSLLLFLKGRSRTVRRGLYSCLSVVLFIPAMGAKETAIVLPFLILAYLLAFDEGRNARAKVSGAITASVPYITVTLLYLVLRIHVLGGMGGYRSQSASSAASVAVYGINILHAYFQDLVYPVDFFGVVADSGYILTPLFVLYIVCYAVVFLWSNEKAGEPRDGRRVMVFLGTWLALPLLLFICTLTFSHRSMYLSVIPFSGMVAFPIVRSEKTLRNMWTRARNAVNFNRTRVSHGFVASRIVVIGLGFAVSCSLLSSSAMFNRYGHWTDSARISSRFLNRLNKEIANIPLNSSIHVYNLPDRILSYQNTIPHAREVTYLQDYSIESWLNLRIPGNRLKVVIHSRSQPHTFSGDLYLIVRVLEQRHVVARVMLDKTRYAQRRLYTRLNHAAAISPE